MTDTADLGSPIESCTMPTGYAENGEDCDDKRSIRTPESSPGTKTKTKTDIRMGKPTRLLANGQQNYKAVNELISTSGDCGR